MLYRSQEVLWSQFSSGLLRWLALVMSDITSIEKVRAHFSETSESEQTRGSAQQSHPGTGIECEAYIGDRYGYSHRIHEFEEMSPSVFVSTRGLDVDWQTNSHLGLWHLKKSKGMS
mmetsp:Transcript_89270/g.130568  ORF Transcript_89270/g.130568 Transcript_89270/m.130568 type:complete len:116 (+) Transcript_89270:311-658(+)